MTAIELLESLELCCEPVTDEQFDAYSKACELLRGTSDREVLARMIRCVRDVEAGEVQYELVEACEASPAHVYVPALLDAAPNALRRAPSWFRLMLQTVFNGSTRTQIVAESWPQLSSEVRGAVLDFLDRLDAEYLNEEPKYGQIAARLRAIQREVH